MTAPDYDQIRPYRDEEVATVIRSWADRPELQSLLQQANVSRLFGLPVLGRWLTQLWVSRQLGRIHSVAALQDQIAPWVQRLLHQTTDGVTWSGLEHLDPERSYLFLSNHRDIVSDPAVVNYLLYNHGFGTTRIAIGDNLTKNPLVADLMRLNKSFIVRRNLASAREMRNSYLTLSSFIHDSIDQGESVWLAQREGRAKDGIDRTEPAILKMLHMSRKQSGESFASTLERLRVVPVSISYELDPCDYLKAREMEARARTGEYSKGPREDVESIVQGIRGSKGRVHVHFGTPLSDDLETPTLAAEAVDEQVRTGYRLFPIQYAAVERLQVPLNELPTSEHKLPSRRELEQARRVLEQRLAECTWAVKPHLLAQYANPLLRAYHLDTALIDHPTDTH